MDGREDGRLALWVWFGDKIHEVTVYVLMIDMQV